MQTSAAEVLPARPAEREESRDEWLRAQKRKVADGESARSNDLLAIPMRYRGKAFINFHNSTVTVAAKQACRVTNLYVWGPCGTGKTHLALALLLDLYAEALTLNGSRWSRPAAQFVSVQELVHELKKCASSHSSDFDIIRELVAMRFLVLDDFCAARLTDYAIEMHSTIINEVFLHRPHGVIITSNLSLDDVAQRLDDRTASRICEMCRVIKIDGPDRRIQAHKE